MNLTSITVRYLRRKQPVQFEPAEAELSATFTAPEGSTVTLEQASALYDKALGDVKLAVQAKMNGQAPAAAPVAEIKGSVLKTTTPVKPAPVAAEAPAETPPAAPKKGPGRPAKSTLAPPPAAAPKPAAAPPAGGSEFDDEPAAAAPATGGGEFDDDAQAAAAATPEDDEFAENEVKPMSAMELQQTLSGLVTGKKVAGSDVKAILAKYNVTRSADTQEADRAKILAEVKALIKVAK